jgi:hypothetical protein
VILIIKTNIYYLSGNLNKLLNHFLKGVPMFKSIRTIALLYTLVVLCYWQSSILNAGGLQGISHSWYFIFGHIVASLFIILSLSVLWDFKTTTAVPLQYHDTLYKSFGLMFPSVERGHCVISEQYFSSDKWTVTLEHQFYHIYNGAFSVRVTIAYTGAIDIQCELTVNECMLPEASINTLGRSVYMYVVQCPFRTREEFDVLLREKCIEYSLPPTKLK